MRDFYGASAQQNGCARGMTPTTDVLMKICEALNCHLDDIMETVDDK